MQYFVSKCFKQLLNLQHGNISNGNMANEKRANKGIDRLEHGKI